MIRPPLAAFLSPDAQKHSVGGAGRGQRPPRDAAVSALMARTVLGAAPASRGEFFDRWHGGARRRGGQRGAHLPRIRIRVRARVRARV